MPVRLCGNCRHFDLAPEEGDEAGYCLESPPQLVALPVRSPREDDGTEPPPIITPCSVRPQTVASSRCGRWAPLE